jgi:hypothetical protein
MRFPKVTDREWDQKKSVHEGDRSWRDRGSWLKARIVAGDALRSADSTECVRINCRGLAPCLRRLPRKGLLAKLVPRGVASLVVREFEYNGPFFKRRAFVHFAS